MDILYFVYLSVDGHFGCSYFLAITNNTSMNTCVYDFMWTFVFLSSGNMPRNGIAGHMVALCLAI